MKHILDLLNMSNLDLKFNNPLYVLDQNKKD